MTISIPQLPATASEGHGIEWLNRPGTVGRTWNPIAGCTKVAPGCLNCYAMKMAMRIACAADAAERKGQTLTPKMRAYQRVVKRGQAGKDGIGAPLPQWNNRVVLIPEALEEPLRWRKPATVFMSMTDLFHEQVPFEYIDRVLAVMALTPQHTYLILTKRPERAAEYLGGQFPAYNRVRDTHITLATIELAMKQFGWKELPKGWKHQGWPLPSLWLGCSVSDQKTADESIPHLLRCPAAVRFVSYEPALWPVDFSGIDAYLCPTCGRVSTSADERAIGHCGSCHSRIYDDGPFSGIDWLIVGGESGPGARPFDVAWARSTIRQCREAGVACFVKQLGSNSGDDRFFYKLRDPKGGDWNEWQEDLRVREWPRPEVRTTSSTGCAASDGK